METERSLQAHALFCFRQGGISVKDFAMNFLSTALYSGFNERELKAIFNSCLDQPFPPAEMRRTNPLSFVDQLEYTMEREQSRESSMAVFHRTSGYPIGW